LSLDRCASIAEPADGAASALVDLQHLEEFGGVKTTTSRRPDWQPRAPKPVQTKLKGG
jgi:hypothetical protein